MIMMLSPRRRIRPFLLHNHHNHIVQNEARSQHSLLGFSVRRFNIYAISGQPFRIKNYIQHYKNDMKSKLVNEYFVNNSSSAVTAMFWLILGATVSLTTTNTASDLTGTVVCCCDHQDQQQRQQNQQNQPQLQQSLNIQNTTCKNSAKIKNNRNEGNLSALQKRDEQQRTQQQNCKNEDMSVTFDSETTVIGTSPSFNVSTTSNIIHEDDMSLELRALAEARIEEATRKATQHSGGMKVFSGNGNVPLALEICKHLGINLGKAKVGRFADGEVSVLIEENVRGKDVYIVQSTGPPVNDNMIELLLMVSTMRRSSASQVTVVIPYYGYARQDRKMQARVPISAADVARLLEAVGVDRVIAVDLHCGQIQGFFGPRVPVDNLDGGIVGLDYFGSKDLHNPVIVSPDVGGVYRAKNFKDGLEKKYTIPNLTLAVIIKQRAKAGVVDQMDLVGDVRDCDCILVDDMIDTAGTLVKAANVLKANGARRVFAFASHGLLSGPGNERIANCTSLQEVVVLNTLPTSSERIANTKLTELSIAPLLAQAIFNVHAQKSLSALYKYTK